MTKQNNKINLFTRIGKLNLKNPVMVASGTFGYAEEFENFINLKHLGALVTKTVTLKPRIGNPMPRTCETPSGMLNSIGLENPGVEKFIQKKLPVFAKIGVPIIISIASEEGMEEFAELAGRIDKLKEVQAIELNISCPNIHYRNRGHSSVKNNTGYSGGVSPITGRRLISQDPKATFEAVRIARQATKKTLITKLSPNVTDITEIAMAAKEAGSDALSLINTLSGMSINVKTRKPKIAMVTAGLSGPAIRPVAVRMVWEIYQKVKLPIIGMGGIVDTESALEFFLAGASAVAVGTANFINPAISEEIISGLKNYLKENKINSIKEIIGALKQ